MLKSKRVGGKRLKCIAVTSGKGGSGKSCVAAYTGAALAKSGNRTLLLELGGTFMALDLIVGMKEQAVFDSTDVFAGRCDAQKAIVPTAIQRNLHLLPAGLNPVADATDADLQALLETLGKSYDFIIVDGVDFSVFSPKFADMVLQVLTPDSLCVRACAQQAVELNQAGVKQLRLVINNVPPQVLPMYGAKDFDDVIDLVGVQLIAVIPASPKLQYSSNNAQALDEESITVKVFDNLAGRLLGKRLPLLIR